MSGKKVKGAFTDDMGYDTDAAYDRAQFRLLKAAINAIMYSDALSQNYYASDGPIDCRGTDEMGWASIKEDRALAKLVDFGGCPDLADALRRIADELDPE